MKLLHFGFAVRDIETTSAAYRQLFGINWDPIVRHERPSLEQGGAPSAMLVTHGYTSDGTEIEMVQTLAGHSPDTALLGDREGISHVAFEVEDLAAEKARLEDQGLVILEEGKAPRANWLFVQDARLGGALVQLVQLNKQAVNG